MEKPSVSLSNKEGVVVGGGGCENPSVSRFERARGLWCVVVDIEWRWGLVFGVGRVVK